MTTPNIKQRKSNRQALKIRRILHKAKVSKLRKVMSQYAARRSVYKRALRTEATIAHKYLETKYSVKRGRPAYLKTLVGPQIIATNFRDKGAAYVLPTGKMGGQSLNHFDTIINNWRPIQKLDRSGLLMQRIPQFDKNNRPVLKNGKPVTVWDIPNRDVASLTQAARKGLKFGYELFDYRPLLSMSLTENFKSRRIKKATRQFNRRNRLKKTAVASLEGWLKPSNRRPGLAFNGAPSKLFGSGSKVLGKALNVVDVASSVFRSNSPRFAQMCKLPVAKSHNLWVRPKTIDLRRCVYRTRKGMPLPISTSYSIVSNTAMEIRRLTSKNVFIPHWWLNMRLRNLLSSVILSSNRSKRIETMADLRPITSVGSGKFFHDVLIQTKNSAIRDRLKHLIPLIAKFGCNSRLGHRYYVTKNKFRTFTTYAQRGLRILTDRSLYTATRRSLKSGGDLGLYQRHPRFSAKMIRVVEPDLHTLRNLIINKQRKASSIKTFKRRLWLRNANTVN